MPSFFNPNRNESASNRENREKEINAKNPNDFGDKLFGDGNDIEQQDYNLVVNNLDKAIEELNNHKPESSSTDQVSPISKSINILQVLINRSNILYGAGNDLEQDMVKYLLINSLLVNNKTIAIRKEYLGLAQSNGKGLRFYTPNGKEIIRVKPGGKIYELTKKRDELVIQKLKDFSEHFVTTFDNSDQKSRFSFLSSGQTLLDLIKNNTKPGQIDQALIDKLSLRIVETQAAATFTKNNSSSVVNNSDLLDNFKRSIQVSPEDTQAKFGSGYPKYDICKPFRDQTEPQNVYLDNFIPRYQELINLSGNPDGEYSKLKPVVEKALAVRHAIQNTMGFNGYTIDFSRSNFLSVADIITPILELKTEIEKIKAEKSDLGLDNFYDSLIDDLSLRLISLFEFVNTKVKKLKENSVKTEQQRVIRQNRGVGNLVGLSNLNLSSDVKMLDSKFIDDLAILVHKNMTDMQNSKFGVNINNEAKQKVDKFFEEIIDNLTTLKNTTRDVAMLNCSPLDWQIQLVVAEKAFEEKNFTTGVKTIVSLVNDIFNNYSTLYANGELNPDIEPIMNLLAYLVTIDSNLTNILNELKTARTEDDKILLKDKVNDFLFEIINQKNTFILNRLSTPISQNFYNSFDVIFTKFYDLLKNETNQILNTGGGALGGESQPVLSFDEKLEKVSQIAYDTLDLSKINSVTIKDLLDNNPEIKELKLTFSEKIKIIRSIVDSIS